MQSLLVIVTPGAHDRSRALWEGQGENGNFFRLVWFFVVFLCCCCINWPQKFWNSLELQCFVCGLEVYLAYRLPTSSPSNNRTNIALKNSPKPHITIDLGLVGWWLGWSWEDLHPLEFTTLEGVRRCPILRGFINHMSFTTYPSHGMILQVGEGSVRIGCFCC